MTVQEVGVDEVTVSYTAARLIAASSALLSLEHTGYRELGSLPTLQHVRQTTTTTLLPPIVKLLRSLVVPDRSPGATCLTLVMWD